MSRNFDGPFVSRTPAEMTNLVVTPSAFTQEGWYYGTAPVLSITINEEVDEFDEPLGTYQAALIGPDGEIAKATGLATMTGTAVPLPEINDSGYSAVVDLVSPTINVATEFFGVLELPVLAGDANTTPEVGFEFQNDLEDAGAGNFDGSVTSGTPVYVAGAGPAGGYALRLPGTSTATWIRRAINNAIGQTTEGRTLHFFYKYTGTTETSTIVMRCQNNTASSQWTITITINPGSGIWSIAIRTNATTHSTTTINGGTITGGWHQVAAVFDGSAGLYVFHDGELIASVNNGSVTLSALNGLTSPVLVFGDSSNAAGITLVAGAFVSRRMNRGDIVNLWNGGNYRPFTNWAANSVANAPTLVSATGGTGTCDCVVTQGLNGGQAVTAFKVYQGGSLKFTTANANLSFTATGLDVGTDDITVKAVNPQGDSAASNAIEATVIAATQRFRGRNTNLGRFGLQGGFFS